MKKIFMFLIILFVPFMVNGKELKLEWQKSWGGIYDESGVSGGATSDGGYVVSGTSYIEEFPENKYDGFLLKYDRDGNMLWRKMWGGSELDFFVDMCVTQDDNVIV